jgi:hypothetical protein
MASRAELQEWVAAALRRLGGRGTVAEVAKEIWNNHEEELKASGNLLYTWQYDMRWAAMQLRKRGVMKAALSSPSGVWELAATKQTL